LKTLILSLALLAAGCAAPAVPVPPASIPAPIQAPTPGPKSLAFGDEIVLRHTAILYVGTRGEFLPPGTKVRIAGEVEAEDRIKVLVLDSPHAGASGRIDVRFTWPNPFPLTEAAPE
jgi:hypothetical protein